MSCRPFLFLSLVGFVRAVLGQDDSGGGEDDAEELAEKCGMEYGSFRRKMKKVTGYTPKEWVVKERAKDVEHYLKNTHLTLTEVAFTTGFSSTSNLNDFCRAYLLDTPGEIRKKWLETRKCTDSGI